VLGGGEITEADERGGVGLPFGGCRCAGKDAGIGMERAGHDNTAIAGLPGGGVAGKAKGAVWAVAGAAGERSGFEGFLPRRDVFVGKDVELLRDRSIFRR
jgi:hypothetical protein